MKVNVVTKNGVSVLSFKTNFNEVLDENFAAICEAIANKGKAYKPLFIFWICHLRTSLH